MIYIDNAKNIHGNKLNLVYKSSEDKHLDATGLTVFPGLIDPHVHFRTPGMEEKEDWQTAALAAIHGGYTTVFDMPNTLPPTTTHTLFEEKKALIDSQLQKAGIPLRYELYFGADKNHLDQIPTIKNNAIGIKVFMGCSTGNLVIDDDESLHAVFKIAAEQNLLVAVHAEDEAMIKNRKKIFHEDLKYASHSDIRNTDVACCAVEKAISLTRLYGTKLYILHVSSADEITLIKQAKAEGLPVFAETTPHHLFLNTDAYKTLQGKAVVNPPLRSPENQQAVFAAILDGTIDTIGSDHAPHLPHEKALPYGQCPSGMPGIETTLPLLLTAYHEQLISLERIIALTCTKPREIFNLPENNDIVLVDLNKSKTIANDDLKTKCKWSAFTGTELKGWPVYTFLKGFMFPLF
ncbi:MAG: dihydroorotase [Gammaproteobacteria bacterium]